jgi:hypothetical protein
VRVDARGAQRFHLRERRRGGARPSISSGQVQDLHFSWKWSVVSGQNRSPGH